MMLVILSLVFWAVSIWAGLGLDANARTAALERDNRAYEARELADKGWTDLVTGSYGYFSSTGSPPATGPMVQTVSWLNDGVQSYHRQVVLVPYDPSADPVALANTGECHPGSGATTPTDPDRWCGPPQAAAWYALDSRARMWHDRRTEQRLMRLTALRLARSGAGAYGHLATLATPIGSGSPGYGTSSLCQGLSSLGGAILDCADMYRLGAPFYYSSDGSSWIRLQGSNTWMALQHDF